MKVECKSQSVFSDCCIYTYGYTNGYEVKQQFECGQSLIEGVGMNKRMGMTTGAYGVLAHPVSLEAAADVGMDVCTSMRADENRNVEGSLSAGMSVSMTIVVSTDWTASIGVEKDLTAS